MKSVFDCRACGNCSFGNPKDCLKPQCVTADGYYRHLLTINRQLPGPMLQVMYTEESGLLSSPRRNPPLQYNSTVTFKGRMIDL